MKVDVLVLEGCIALPAIGSLELLTKSGHIACRLGVFQQNPFEVELVSPAGREVRSVDGLPVRCSRTIREPAQTDLAIVPSLDEEVLPQLERNRACIPWLKELHRRGADIASICTGAFLLAEAGLLDGRRATTHWASRRLFAERYPQVRLQDASIIVDEGSIITSGGATSFLNLIMYLVEKHCGTEVAHVASRMFLIDLNKGPQTAYAIFSTQKAHQDSAVLKAQSLMEDRPQARLSVPGLCSAVGLSRRSFERRFKLATGNTPLEYLQRVRVEAAKKRLERTAEGIEQIAEAVGYEDLPTFRRLFCRLTGMTPFRYRRRYGLAASG